MVRNNNTIRRFEQRIDIIFPGYTTKWMSPGGLTLSQRVLASFLDLKRSEGLAVAVKMHKEWLRVCSRIIMGLDAGKQMGPRWYAVKRSWPKALKLTLREEKELLQSHNFARYFLTLLSYYKSIVTEPDYDISTITGPSKVDLNPKSPIMLEIISYLPQILQDLKVEQYDRDKHNRGSPIHVTLKAGANGPRAMGATSLLDMIALTASGKLDDALEMLMEVLSPSNFQKVASVFFNTSKFISQMHPGNLPSKALVNSRIHFIPEGGGKTRVICIGDIWSQIALKPIHKHLMHTLGTLSWDGTFSHNLLAIKLLEWTSKGPCYCFDLKAATDRMPLILQIEVLKPIFGAHVTDLWNSLIADHTIDCRGTAIRYAVGQPMGYLSSWAAMALTHHCIIQYCYMLEGVLVPDRHYAVIGDDMCIYNNRAVADRYLEVLLKLGMDVSLGKSVYPHVGSLVQAGELAKRFFTFGKEISPITPQQILLSTNSLNDLLTLLQNMSDRSYLPSKESMGLLRYSNSPDHLNANLIAYRLIFHMTASKFVDALIFLSSPLSPYFKGLSADELDTQYPLIAKVRSHVWDGLSSSFHAKWAQFLLRELAEKIVRFEAQLKAKNPTLRGELDNLAYSPLVIQYFKDSIDEIREILQMYNTTYVDEEGDEDAILEQTDPNNVLKELMARPDMEDAPLFQGGVSTTTVYNTSLLLKFLKADVTTSGKINPLSTELRKYFKQHKQIST